MDVLSLCRNFFASTFIPITYFRWPDEQIFACPDLFLKQAAQNRTLAEKISFSRNPDYFITDSYAYFGFINLDHSASTMDYLIIGPVFSTPVSRETVDLFLTESRLFGAEAEEASDALLRIPQVTFHQFLGILTFLNQCVNGTVIDPESHFQFSIDPSLGENMSRRYSDILYEKREETEIRNTWDLERQVMACVKSGEPYRLSELLLQSGREKPSLNTGVSAGTPLRNQRNMFIATASLAARAAIEGGLDVEQAYSLSDVFIQECERTVDLQKIDELNYHMLMDFAMRVSRQKISAEKISDEIFRCVQFISQRPNESLGINDVAAFSGKSRAYITKRFKEEMHCGISEYITMRKMEEACNLLRFTAKPLSEISSYLCFSSQSYFQNVFKKRYGITPAQYRRNSGSTGQ